MCCVPNGVITKKYSGRIYNDGQNQPRCGVSDGNGMMSYHKKLTALGMNFEGAAKEPIDGNSKKRPADGVHADKGAVDDFALEQSPKRWP